MRLACVVVIAMAGVARADEPLALVAGLGARKAWLTSNDGPPDDALTPVVVAAAGYRIVPSLALGVHVAVTRATGSWSFDGPSNTVRRDWTIYPLDLAVTAEFEEDRYTVAPWLGLHRSSLSGSDTECARFGDSTLHCTTTPASTTANALAFGLTASVIVDRRVPLAILLDFQGSNEGALRDTVPKVRFHYSAITLGVGYRR